jgi:hypothetical protein
MQIVSNEFATAMVDKPYIAKITLSTGTVIQGKPILEIDFRGGANNKGDAVAIGSAIAASVEINLEASEVGLPDKEFSFTVELGLDLTDSTEWLNMGNYMMADVVDEEDRIILRGIDAMSKKFDREYEPLDGINFTDGAVDSIEFLTAMCSRRGVAADFYGLEGIPLLGFDPAGCTERKIIGMIAGLYGRFAVIDRDGILRFRWYAPVDVTIDGDSYYDGGLEKAGYGFSVGWLKCFVEPLEETIVEGNDAAEQGIYFECPWMNQERLVAIWEQVKNFTFHPVSQLAFFGDPRLDPGDVITLTDCKGATVTVPVMSIIHEFDGGIRTEITAQGQSKTDVYEGPVQREVKRTAAKIVKKQKEIEISISEADRKISSITLDVDNIKSEVKKQSDTVGKIQQDMTSIQQTADDVSIKVQKIIDNGTSKVTTGMGYTFGDDGLHIAKNGEQISNLVDHTGVHVKRGEEVMLQADANGVNAADVTIRNYLIVGNHARFEDYTDGTDSERTACFWI